jgi:membrane dipeptidase
MRKIIALVLAFSILIIGTAFVYSKRNGVMIPLKLHIESVVVDSHNDTMMKIVDEETWLPSVDLRGDTDLQIDLAKLRAGNLSVPFFAAYSSPYHGNPDRSVSRTLALINALYYTEKHNRDILKISSSYKEIEAALLKKMIAAVPAIEGAYSLSEGNAHELLKQYDDLGIKAIGFTWNYSNALGEGLYRSYADIDGSFSQGGLTELGRKTVEEMNRLGMVIDVSHLAETSFWDVIETSRLPIIASHSGAFSEFIHERNLKDDQILAIKENGGVVGVVFYTDFISEPGTASISRIVDHIDYIVKLAGIDHAGLGSDFDGAVMPQDLGDSSGMYKITEELVKRGYSELDIKKILGLNMLRVIKENDMARIEEPSLEGVTITPLLQMGERFITKTPSLRASITGNNGKDLSYRVILNGIPQKAMIENDQILLDISSPLKEKFYVVTFEASDGSGSVERATRILYIEEN